MLGIIIATHGTLCEGLKNAGEVIMGQTQRIETVRLLPGQDVTTVKTDIQAAIERLGAADGVLILSDIAGASPFNQSLLALHELPSVVVDHIRLFYGVNLPMLLSAMNQQLLGATVEAASAAILSEMAEGVGMWQPSATAQDEDDDDF